MRLKIAARKSDLARLQAYSVGDALKNKNPNIEIIYKFRESLGDLNLTDPLWKAPEKGVFTEDFYQDLIKHQCDIVVHSWKDLPILNKEKTFIAATLPREDQRDLLLFKKQNHEKVKRTQAIKVLSSSPRRAHNLQDFFIEYLPHKIKDVDFESVRGNIQTRIQKLLNHQEADALIVAKAAIDRLLSAPWDEFRETQKNLRDFLQQLDWMALPLSINPTAAAQGALAIEILRERTDLIKLFNEINHNETFDHVQKERLILAEHGGGCHQAIGVSQLSRPYGDLLFIRGKTDKGVLLGQQTLESVEEKKVKWRGLKTPENMDDFFEVCREPLEFDQKKLNEYNAILISKAEALPSSFKQTDSTLLWTAGLQTWKKIAANGYWVHGSFDGMGEQESSRIDFLAPQRRWIKVSHNDLPSDLQNKIPTLATYQIKIKMTDSSHHLNKFDNFYWNSGSFFLEALAAHPDIIDKIHCCGPGNTSKIIKKILIERGLDPKQHLFIFLNMKEWQKKCKLK